MSKQVADRGRLALVPLLAAAFSVLSGTLVLLGWGFDIRLLRDPLPGPSAMVPTAALCFICCGVSLALQAKQRFPKWQQLLGKVIALPVLIYSLLILFEYVFGVDLGVDRTIFATARENWPVPVLPGRFAPNSALAFAALGIALLLVGRKLGRVVISESCALVAGLTAFVGIVGHLYKVEAMYSVGTHVEMALHTALVFGVLATGVYVARPEIGSAEVVVSRNADGLVARRLLAFSAIMMLALGWARLEMQKYDWVVDPELGTALLVVASVMGFFFLVMNTARVVHRLEADREAATQALIQSEKLASVGRMAATVAHEINNPLAAVMNAVYLVGLDKSLCPQTQANVAMADDQLKRVAHLTRQTLGFYRESRAPALVNAAELVDTTLQIYQQRVEQRGIAVYKRYASDSRVWAVPGELRQVISNLISNSIDALSPGGKLYLRISRSAELQGEGAQAVRITVADNGTGITRENLARVFQPFFTTKDSVGTGLGLWIVKEIVTKSHGSIRIRSREKMGTVCSLLLPAERARLDAQLKVRAAG